MAGNKQRSTSVIAGPTSVPNSIAKVKKQKLNSTPTATSMGYEDDQPAINDSRIMPDANRNNGSDSNNGIILTVAIIVGVIALILAIGGLVIYNNAQEKGDRIWTIIGPIIATAITGLLGLVIMDRRDRK